ncbi:MAG: HAMP domain-containing histidine kinase [Lachnospiraceae bacterium]|nr:HAMP domain-containing histidine kinase [Lachnospiraceae bacterium]
MSNVIAGVAVAALLIVIACMTIQRHRTKRLLRRLDEMLDAGIRGDFRAADYDESQLSRLEAKLEQFLDSSAISARNVSEEHSRMKTLISDISHQTKTPIANLVLYSELLSDANLPEEQRSNVEAIRAQAEKLRFLIDSLVKLSRLENGILSLSPEQRPLQSMLEQIRASYKKKAEAKGLEFVVNPTDASARMDEKWTMEAISNIVDNAIKYTNEGYVHINTQPYELFTRIDISDTGIGIPEVEQAQVFGRFYRSARNKHTEGVGIGLFLAREIISQEGGYIKLSSDETGTTFSVFLPRGEILQN